MHIAYLVNLYPKVTHSFIRREIVGVEESGIKVSRYSIRSPEDMVFDEADQAEALKTQVVLDIGLIRLFFCFFFTAIRRPLDWLKCFSLMWKLYIASDKSFFYSLAYMAEACVLLNWFQRDGIDHVHTHFGTNSTSVAMLCKALGGPSYSFTVHGPEEFDKPLTLSLPVKIKLAEFVVAISDFGKSQLYRWCSHEDWDKVHVVHCGTDDNFLLDSASAIPAENSTFVCVARLSEQKGHFLLLEAIRQLAENGRQFKVILVGDGPFRPALENLISQWNLNKFVEIIGWASGSVVKQKILNARALVLPSFAEGLPVVIMEALALKRPVISTYIAGIPELVKPGVCGWLVPAGNISALTEAMNEALNSPISRLTMMGEAGAKQVAQQHNATEESKKLVALFQISVKSAKKIEASQEANTTSKNPDLSVDVS